jgi:hypothetical protein
MKDRGWRIEDGGGLICASSVAMLVRVSKVGCTLVLYCASVMPENVAPAASVSHALMIFVVFSFVFFSDLPITFFFRLESGTAAPPGVVFTRRQNHRPSVGTLFPLCKVMPICAFAPPASTGSKTIAVGVMFNLSLTNAAGLCRCQHRWQFSRCENSATERSVRRRNHSCAGSDAMPKVPAPPAEPVAARQLPPRSARAPKAASVQAMMPSAVVLEDLALAAAVFADGRASLAAASVKRAAAGAKLSGRPARLAGAW